MKKVEWFGGRLRELRVAKGLSQQALANLCGMTREGIAQMETRRRKPSWEAVLAIADALAVEYAEFAKPPTTKPPSGPGRPKKKNATKR